MAEPFDEYVDQFIMGASPYGVIMNFRKTSSTPASPGTTPPVKEVGSLRMSMEHFKVMAFLMRRQIMEMEQNLGIEISIPVQLMNALHIAPEDWQKLWRREP